MTTSDAQLQRLGLKPLAFLPNTDGFKFVGVDRDGAEHACRVGKWPTGEHYVMGAVFSDLVGWKNGR